MRPGGAGPRQIGRRADKATPRRPAFPSSGKGSLGAILADGSAGGSARARLLLPGLRSQIGSDFVGPFSSYPPSQVCIHRAPFYPNQREIELYLLIGENSLGFGEMEHRPLLGRAHDSPLRRDIFFGRLNIRALLFCVS